ncbi:hypothetical protein Tco_0873080 [Tanacetum coccineum]
MVPLKKVGDEAVQEELGDKIERAATTTSSLEADTSKNEEMEITTTIDGRVKTITKASIRRHLKLEDSDGIPTLPNAKNFEQLALMGPKRTAWEQFSRNITTAIICLATNRTFNFSKMILKHKRHLLSHKRTYVAPTLTQKLFNNMRRVSKGYTGVDIPLFPTMLTAPESSPSRITSSPSLSPQTHPSTSQQPPTPPFMQTIHDAEEPATMPHDSSQPRVQSLGSDEGSLTLNELTVLCTTLSKKVEDLQNDLKQTKLTYGAAYTKLILRVKKLEHKVKASKSRRRARVIISDNEEDLEDSYKHGRIIAEIDQNPSISLVQDEGTSWIQEDADIQTRNNADTEILLEEPTELVEDLGSGKRSEKEVSTVSVSTAEAKLSTVIPEVSTATENLVNKEERQRIARDAEIAKQLQEEIDTTRQEQEKSDLEKALELQKQLDKREEVVAKADPSKVIDWRPVKEQSARKEKEVSEEELKKLLVIVLVEEVYIEALQIKYPIIDWGIFTEESRSYWRIIRVGNHTEVYQVFEDMLKRFDRDDLEKLWDLVKKKFSST